jgi:prevent-host-death family protein
MQVNVHEAKTKLSQLLERVEAGEEVVIARAGRPVARLVRVSAPPRPRTLGRWAGKIQVAADFDELPADVLAGFEGGGDIGPKKRATSPGKRALGRKRSR